MNKSVKKVLSFIGRYKLKITIAIIFGIAGTALFLIVPQRVKEIAAAIQSGLETSVDISSVISQAVIAGAIVIAGYVCNMIFYRRMIKYGRYFGRDITEALNEKINRMSLLKVDALLPGDLITRMTTDVENVSSFLSKTVGSVALSLIQCIGALVMMMSCNVILGLCAAAAGIIGIVLIKIVSKKAGLLMERQRDKLSNLNAQIDESISGFSVIKSFNAEEDILKAFNEDNEKMSKHMRKSRVITGLLAPFMSFLNNGTYVVVCVLGAMFMLGDTPTMSISVLIAFIMYLQLFTAPIASIAETIGEIQLTWVSVKKLADMFDIPENVDEGTKDIEDVKGEVTFENVRFGYSEDAEIIHGFTASVKAGMKVAIVGPTGAGKTTLVNLLMRFYEINSGKIAIDGCDIRDIPRRRLHEILGMVLQDSFIFAGSIRDNIIYTTKDVSDEQLDNVIKQCGLDYFVSTLPDGVDSVLESQDGDGKLSIGDITTLINMLLSRL